MSDDEHDRWANGQIKDKFNKRPKVTSYQGYQNISQPKELSVDEKINKLNQEKIDLLKISSEHLKPKMHHVPRKGFIQLRIASDTEVRRINQKQLRKKIEKIENKRIELINQKDREEERDR